MIRRAMPLAAGFALCLAAGLGCGFLVTLLDSLCTGQVYVPVLALIAREPGAWRSLALLALYNLAFIAPLVAVFMLAARGADAAQMSRWSKRNVFPSKLALGLVFALLGAMVIAYWVSDSWASLPMNGERKSRH